MHIDLPKHTFVRCIARFFSGWKIANALSEEISNVKSARRSWFSKTGLLKIRGTEDLLPCPEPEGCLEVIASHQCHCV